MVFEPLPNLLSGMVNDMIDPEMFNECLVQKKEYFVMQRSTSVDCLTKYGQKADPCKVAGKTVDFFSKLLV